MSPEGMGRGMLAKLIQVFALSIIAFGHLARATNNNSTEDCHGAPPSSVVHGQLLTPAMSPSPANVPPTSKSHLVNLSWTAGVPSHGVPSDPVAGYRIYRKETEKGGWGPLTHGQNLVAGTSCIDHDVQAGRIYYYRAQTVSAAGKVSVYSNQATAAVPR